MSAPYTLSDLVRFTGQKSRTLQFWTMNGAIECDPVTAHGGPGRPRRYSEDEAIIAIILSEISRISLPIGALREIGELVRSIIHHGKEKKLRSPDLIAINFFEIRDVIDKKKIKLVEEYENKYNSKVQNDPGLEIKIKEDPRWIKIMDEILEVNPDYFWSVIELAKQPSEKLKYFESAIRLTIDDTGKWNVELHDLDFLIDERNYKSEYVGNWSIKITINLTRTLSKIRSERK